MDPSWTRYSDISVSDLSMSVPFWRVNPLTVGTPCCLIRYTRFYVFPFVVWHSAIFESHDWLQQMERTLFSGSAQAMKMIFHGFMLVNLILNLISFQRLLFHPHLRSVTARGLVEQDEIDR